MFKSTFEKIYNFKSKLTKYASSLNSFNITDNKLFHSTDNI